MFKSCQRFKIRYDEIFAIRVKFRIFYYNLSPMKNKTILLTLIAAMLLSGCVSSQIEATPSAGDMTITGSTAIAPSKTLPPTETPLPTARTLPTATASPTAIPLPQPVGPDEVPEGINPLTGLPASDPALLDMPPALISISNSPCTARPQAGLSTSAWVYELYIGEGATRYLAVFYGDYPQESDDGDLWLGPVRSGRLPYEKLRQLYRGFLVFASASPRVLPFLDKYEILYGPDEEDVNDAIISIEDLKGLAEEYRLEVGKPNPTGNRYDIAPPTEGQPGTMIWAPYHYTAQAIWRYDEGLGAYLRYQDDCDGETFIQSVDRLNNQPLAYENVVVLFSDIHFYDLTLFNIDLMYIKRYPALLFRDGIMQEIYWTTANGTYEQSTGLLRPIRFTDYDGNPIPLKPGQTWVEIVPRFTQYNETVDSMDYNQLNSGQQPGSGVWALHIYPPELEGLPELWITPGSDE